MAKKQTSSRTDATQRVSKTKSKARTDAIQRVSQSEPSDSADLQSGLSGSSGLKPGPQKRLINIIIRTHRRPAYFEKCLQSIISAAPNNAQASPDLEKCNVALHIIVDDKPTYQYAAEIIEKSLPQEIPFYFHQVSPNQFSPADNYNELLEKGLVKKSNRDRGRHFYDLYINSVIEKIDNGWIWIIDDDKEVAAQNTIAGIMAKIEDPETLLISQHALSVRTVPDGQYWNKLPFTRGQVDMASFIFHASKKHLVVFDGHGAGDWRVANNLAENLKPVWHKQVTTTADNPGNQGKTEM